MRLIESFYGMLENLKKRWSNLDDNFMDGFASGKTYHSACQRAGLGFPPAKFTTNRSEQTNRSIQEFVKKEC